MFRWSRWDDFLIIGLFVVCILFAATCIYGIVAKTIMNFEKAETLASKKDFFKVREVKK